MSKKGFLSRLFHKKDEVADLPSVDSPLFSIPQINVSQKRQTQVNVERSDGIDTVFLRQQMLNFLSIEQIDAIALRLNLDPAQLVGGKGRKVLGIFTAVSQQNIFSQLLKWCQEIDPNVHWQK